MCSVVKRKRAPKTRKPPNPTGPEGQLTDILAELQVIRLRLDYLINQINRHDPGTIQ